ncbi:MAG: NAD(P)-dependent oxidoreductase [Prevotellaceae bacterium]|jgi:dTDP-6-deoxy-L-talose 4-dehydrogenase (NAD+)|nr:NAD(P)-dependent oxidoreductase [Prevotellaceae bacterium]
MRILITGATGFIGRHVVEYLLSLGNHSLITTAMSSEKDALSLCPLLKNTNYISKNLDEKTDNYYSFFLTPDCVIHLSWRGLPNYDELFHIEHNLPANYYFIKNMIQNGLSDITIAGTCFEYGLLNGCLNEEMPTTPVTVYGLAKDTLRKFVETLQQQYSFSVKWLRVFYPYGHGQSEKSLWTQLEQAIINKRERFDMSLGEQLRDYLPSETVAEYIVKVALQNDVTGIINCCSGKPLSVRKFVELFFEERSYSIYLNRGFYPYPKYEPFAFWGDNAKLKRIIG